MNDKNGVPINVGDTVTKDGQTHMVEGSTTDKGSIPAGKWSALASEVVVTAKGGGPDIGQNNIVWGT